MSYTNSGRFLLAFLLLASHLAAVSALPSPKEEWKAAAQRPGPSGGPHGRWYSYSGTAAEDQERLGQVCDVYLTADAPATVPGVGLSGDLGAGCVSVWVADKGDAFTAADLPTNQQDNFLNTLHYNKAILFSDDNMGLRAGSLPMPGSDWDPVCYVVTIDGELALGYEETNGDKILPCPGATEGLRFTPDQIASATEDELQVMCEACYVNVCSGKGSKDPRSCGGNGDGGKDIGDGANQAHLEYQVSSSYHCHLTMADDGACDFVHFDQHVESRNYLMESGVLCGWERVRELQITHCDCTREAGTNNGCGASECVDMAIAGVVCGNCDAGAGCDEFRAYEGIFEFSGMPDPYEGTCGAALKAKEAHGVDSAEFADAKRMCTKGLYCRDIDGEEEECEYYCSLYGADGTINSDDAEYCAGLNGRRRMLSIDEPEVEDGIPYSAVRSNPIPRKARAFA